MGERLSSVAEAEELEVGVHRSSVKHQCMDPYRMRLVLQSVQKSNLNISTPRYKGPRKKTLAPEREQNQRSYDSERLLVKKKGGC